jgi:hypothetical protein
MIRQQAQQQQQGFFHAHPPQEQTNHIYSNGISHEPLDMNPYQQSGQQYYPGSYQQSAQQAYQSQPPYGHPQQQQQQQQQQQAQQQHGQHIPQQPGQWIPPTTLPSIHMMDAAYRQPSYPQMPVSQPASFGVPGSYYGTAPMQIPPQMQAAQAPSVPAKQPMQLSRSGDNGKYKFTLKVEQQPQRARMCGFGDKDRRPITPPPCIRLIVHDVKTGKEIPAASIDGSFFVLQVDLWNEAADREVNVVRSSNTSPSASISTATTTSFPPLADNTSRMGEHYPHRFILSHADCIGLLMGSVAYPGAGYPGAIPVASPQHSTMFTRNLIGSLTVNAAKLVDDKNHEAYWFVLQDLSVRTEGQFRLRMNFIDVGAAVQGTAQLGLNKGKAPVLAHVFSESFQVYSAKKFPGVIESTVLSKCFAQQGIKIPIRKDGAKDEKDDDDD